MKGELTAAELGRRGARAGHARRGPVERAAKARQMVEARIAKLGQRRHKSAAPAGAAADLQPGGPDGSRKHYLAEYQRRAKREDAEFFAERARQPPREIRWPAPLPGAPIAWDEAGRDEWLEESD
ncbi:MAG TPA: hypothetical protein VNF74_00990 [Terriglobales bacterium]|nr:hypothetical protein [Terriglobales bacterium]